MNGGQYVVFALDNERFGLPIESVEQILSAQEVTRIPNSGKEVLGMFELRGKTLPVVDTRIMLGLPAKEPGCSIVVCSKTSRFALVADAVDQIVSFVEDQVIQTDQSVVGRSEDGSLTVLLDIRQLQPALIE